MYSSGPAVSPTTPIQVDLAVAQRIAELVRLGHEAQPRIRRFLGQPGQQARAEGFDETVLGAQRVNTRSSRQVGQLGRTQHRFGVAHQLADLRAQRQRARRGHQAAAGAQSRGSPVVSRRRASARLMAGAQAQAPGGARHAAFG